MASVAPKDKIKFGNYFICKFCNLLSEDLVHIFFVCKYSKESVVELYSSFIDIKYGKNMVITTTTIVIKK